MLRCGEWEGFDFGGGVVGCAADYLFQLLLFEEIEDAFGFGEAVGLDEELGELALGAGARLGEA